MKQEEKELLLKDLSSRLSYGVKIFVDEKVETLDGLNILDNVIEYGIFLSCDIEEVKPYLFPLSSMTEEQRKEYTSLLDHIMTIEGDVCDVCTVESINWLLENYFDYRGLIDKGLAIDATGLGIY